MVNENKPRRIKQLIKVQDVNRTIPLDKISNWAKHLADEVFRSIPEGTQDMDVVITLDFSGGSGMRKSQKKMLMDTLEEELLR